ncbi:hypothetical protein C900_05335 [Fulvivirga imtechensis AK7]|uniref:GIY-YIG domain-containing protein n=1 Tax=Fulvivirga imtechensis AK7 TaxID=1237149 RepID=L8JP52_9BACT|nr:hypothetical protein [Fulvivirga imtechensis]ELR69264.1 hypothetical protein C900_05335 [Fulvivirga imtechensis AK7]
MENFDLTFEEYTEKVLPEHLGALKSLMGRAYRVKDLFGKGQGEKSIMKKLGRDTDFKGVYAFIDGSDVIYVGTSEKVINRVSYQIKGYTKYQAHLAWELAKYNDLYINKRLKIPNLDKAKSMIMNMKVMFLEISSPVERHLTEIYSCMHFDCKFNFFETHR